jgi:amino acid permease
MKPLIKILILPFVTLGCAVFLTAKGQSFSLAGIIFWSLFMLSTISILIRFIQNQKEGSTLAFSAKYLLAMAISLLIFLCSLIFGMLNIVKSNFGAGISLLIISVLFAFGACRVYKVIEEIDKQSSPTGDSK